MEGYYYGRELSLFHSRVGIGCVIVVTGVGGCVGGCADGAAEEGEGEVGGGGGGGETGTMFDKGGIGWGLLEGRRLILKSLHFSPFLLTQTMYQDNLLLLLLFACT